MPIFTAPPRPSFALRVSVTGHRPGKQLPDSTTDRVRADIASVLGRLAKAAHAVARRYSDVFDQGKVQLKFLSALAEGADRIAAQQALSEGWQLEVVLPFKAAAYEDDFALQLSKSAFRQLLSRATSTFCLDMPAEASLRSRAYQAAGHVALDNCDLLIAVWDGGPPHGVGGTAEIVREALASGMPVIHVHATEAVAPSYLRSGREPVPLRENLSALVERLTAPPQQRSSLNCFLTEAEEQGAARDGRLFRWWRFADCFSTVLCQFGGHDHADQDDLQPVAHKIHTATSSENMLHERHKIADEVSTHLGHVYRSAFMLVFLLSTLAVLAGLGNVFWWDSVKVKIIAVLVELFFILLILVIIFTGNRRGWHRRWLETRRLAELLRVAEAMVPAGGGSAIAPDDDNDKSAAWTEWYARASLREASVPNITANRTFLRNLADGFTFGLLDGQIRYHRSSSRNLHRLHHGLDRVGMVLFGITLCICVAFLLVEAVLSSGIVHDKAVHTFVTSWIKPAVTLCSAGLPALGAALYGIRAQGDYEASASRSESTARALLAIRDRILATRDAPDIVVLRGLFGQAAEIMQSDLSDWRQIYRHRPIALPA